MNSTNIVISKSKPRRRRNRRRGDASGDSIGKYAGDAWDLAKRTARGLNEIRRLINVEEKAIVTDVSTTPNTTGNVNGLSLIAQGVNVSERVGDSIKAQHLSFLGRVGVNASVTTFSCIRIIIFRDMEAAGTTITTGEVLETVATSGAPRSPINWLNRGRVVVLYDEFLAVGPAAGGGNVVTFGSTLLLDRHIKFRATTASSAAAAEGALYVLTISDEASNAPDFKMTARLTFTDD